MRSRVISTYCWSRSASGMRPSIQREGFERETSFTISPGFRYAAARCRRRFADSPYEGCNAGLWRVLLSVVRAQHSKKVRRVATKSVSLRSFADATDFLSATLIVRGSVRGPIWLGSWAALFATGSENRAKPASTRVRETVFFETKPISIASRSLRHQPARYIAGHHH